MADRPILAADQPELNLAETLMHGEVNLSIHFAIFVERITD